MQTNVTLSEATKALFIAHANEPRNWSRRGLAFLGTMGHVPELSRAVVDELEAQGLVTRKVLHGGRFVRVVFTPTAKQYAKSLGINAKSCK